MGYHLHRLSLLGTAKFTGEA